MKVYTSQSWSSFFIHSEPTEQEFDNSHSFDLTIRHDEGVISISTPQQEAIEFERLSIEEARQRIEVLKRSVDFAEAQMKKSIGKYIR